LAEKKNPFWEMLPPTLVSELESLDKLHLAPESRYPLDLHLEPEALPCPVRPVSILLDSETIPDLLREAWPFQWRSSGLEKQLRLWVSAPSGASLEYLLDGFSEGMRRLERIFPFLPEHTLSIRPSLGMEECGSEASRTASLKRLEREAIERHRFSSLRTETRNPGVSLLLSSLHCHLPYPLGPLLGAKRSLEEITVRTQRRARREARRTGVPLAR
jgi:hypothetical protein